MLIGITGGIGSGKSTILRVIAEQGYPVYDCDAEAKRIIAEDESVRRQMTDLFGAQVYENGIYQTQYVAGLVFADPDKLARLNAIVRPAVAEDVRRWSAGQPLAFVERVLHRAAEQGQTITVEQVRARIRSQMQDEQHADLTIVNDGKTPVSVLADQLIQYTQTI